MSKLPLLGPVLAALGRVRRNARDRRHPASTQLCWVL